MGNQTQYQGQVDKLFPSRFGGGSFALAGQRGLYFNTKTPLPGFVQPGATVKFTGELGHNGKSVFVEGNGIEQIAQAAPAAGAAASVGGTVNYEKRDAQIRLQSCRNSAIATVGLLLQYASASVLPSGENKKAGAIEALIDRFTAVFYDDTETFAVLDRAAVEPAKPKAAAKKAKAVEQDDEEEEGDEEGLPE